ncbi:MAG: hypothetical protein QMD10_10285 [Desulfitobacteriaceae bacterium]|nr:hypothetical protein [Desulfitobacteriaceae bacterium]
MLRFFWGQPKTERMWCLTRIGVFAVAFLCLLVLAWPAFADSVTVSVVPLAPETAIAVDTASPPVDLKAPPGATAELPVAVKNLSVSTAIYVNVVAHDAEAVNAGDSGWTLTTADPPGRDQYGVAFNGVPVPPGGYRAPALDKGATMSCALGVKLPAVMTGYGPRMVKVDVFGSL